MILCNCFVSFCFVLLLFTLNKQFGIFETHNNNKTNTENEDWLLCAHLIQFRQNLLKKNNIVQSVGMRPSQNYKIPIKIHAGQIKCKMHRLLYLMLTSFLCCVVLVTLLRILSEEDDDEVMLSVVAVYCMPNTCMHNALVGVDFLRLRTCCHRNISCRLCMHTQNSHTWCLMCFK